MEKLKEAIERTEQEMKSFVPSDATSLENFRIKFLGTKGALKELFSEMKNVATVDKKEAGLLLNAFKQKTEQLFETYKTQFQNSSIDSHEMDLSLPATPYSTGSRHPLRLVENKIVTIFERMGFAEATGPEIEDDWHNFTSLNMPENHPARDMQDTFYLATNPDWVLRTHTSSVQARVLESQSLPVRIICPGRVYRNETISARAHCFFHQVEGLYLDKNVSFADLKQTLYYFVT